MEPKGWSHTINSFLEPEDANADEDRDVRRFKGLCSLATNFCSLDSGLLAQEESCEFVGFSRLCGPLSPPCSSRFRASRFPISSSTTYDAIILSDGRLICSHLKARCLPGSQGKPVVTCKVRSCCVRSLLHECSTVFLQHKRLSDWELNDP
jgi:hypothetical protein